MIAYPGEYIKLYISIRNSDGTAPASISDVQFSIRQDDREITAFASMNEAGGTRYYAAWTIPAQQATGRYFVIVTATVNGSAWEKVIDAIEVRRNTENMIESIYIKSLREGEHSGLQRK